MQSLKQMFTFASSREICRMDKKEKKKKNVFVKMVEDKRSIIKSIREGIPTKKIEEERNVKFVTPV